MTGFDLYSTQDPRNAYVTELYIFYVIVRGRQTMHPIQPTWPSQLIPENDFCPGHREVSCPFSPVPFSVRKVNYRRRALVESWTANASEYPPNALTRLQLPVELAVSRVPRRKRIRATWILDSVDLAKVHRSKIV